MFVGLVALELRVLSPVAALPETSDARVAAPIQGGVRIVGCITRASTAAARRSTCEPVLNHWVANELPHSVPVTAATTATVRDVLGGPVVLPGCTVEDADERVQASCSDGTLVMLAIPGPAVAPNLLPGLMGSGAESHRAKGARVTVGDAPCGIGGGETTCATLEAVYPGKGTIRGAAGVLRTKGGVVVVVCEGPDSLPSACGRYITRAP